MVQPDSRPARYIRLCGSDGIRYRFFCEASGAAVCTTEPVISDSHRGELHIAWEQQGRQHFSQCQKCRRWVWDVMYNADTGQCVLCSPWEEAPVFCCGCGAPAVPEERYCRKCGQSLRYGEVVLNE